jgi:hypothetical protein
MKTFTVAYDPEFRSWIVLSTETKATSFAMVPVGKTWEFATKAEAVVQAWRLSGTAVAVRMIETPERFEAVADTRYGPAWGAE